MAENLKSLKQRIKTSKNIAQIAKAMEMISASKIKRAKEMVENNRPYAERITNVLERILENIDVNEFPNPYLQPSASPKKLLIAVSPDRGLCGALHDNLLRKMMEFDSKDTVLVTMGKKAEKFALKTDGELVASFPMGTTQPQYSVIFPLLDIVGEQYLSGKVSEVSVLFTEFRSMFSQVPVVKRLLPVSIEKKNEKKEEIIYKFEPGIETILHELLPYYVEVKLYNSLINAFTAEQAARMVSMQNAKNNALDIGDQITLAYNKLRQAKITSEILDITNSQFA